MRLDLTDATARHRFAIVSAAMVAIASVVMAQNGDPTPPDQPPQTVPTDPAEKPADLPPATDLVRASREKMGGQTALDELKTFEIRATLAGPMGEVRFHVQSAATGAFHIVQQMGDEPPAEVGYDGSIGWMNRPEQGYEVIDPAVFEQGRREFGILFPYWTAFNPQRAFDELETIDRGVFADQECYKVRLGRKANDETGLQRFAYYDVDEQLMRGMGVVQTTPIGEMTIEFAYGDWKKIGELNVFTSLTIRTAEQPDQAVKLQYTDVQFNKVDPSVFALPQRVKELAEEAQAARSASPQPQVPQNSDPDPPSPEENR